MTQQSEAQECPYSSAVSGMSELRKCKSWGYCTRSGYAGDFRKCPTFKELDGAKK